MSLPDEDLWYCKQNGYYRLPEPLPADIRRLSKILARDPAYVEAATHPPVLAALEHFLGPNIDLLTNKHNHLMVRPPNSGVVPWHTGEQIYDPVLFTALVYLEESTVENGCIRIVPGSHQRPFRGEKRYPAGEFPRHALYRHALPVPMPRGGVLLFDDRIYHGADVNHPPNSRRCMTLAYRAHDAHDVLKDDPEKILVRGERIYTGHPHPFPKS